MDTAKEHLLKFISLVATHHPNDVKVNQINGQPVVFEITINQKDAEEVEQFFGVFQAIIGCTTELSCDQFEVKILVK